MAGENVAHMAEELIAAGADNVYAIEHQLLPGVRPDGLSQGDRRRDRQVLAADRPVCRDAAGPRAGPDGLVPDRLRPDRRLHGARYPRQLPQRARSACCCRPVRPWAATSWRRFARRAPSRQMATARPGVMKRLPAGPVPQGQDRQAQGRADRRRCQPRDHQDGAGPRAGELARRRHRHRRQGHAEPRQLREARRQL